MQSKESNGSKSTYKVNIEFKHELRSTYREIKTGEENYKRKEKKRGEEKSRENKRRAEQSRADQNRKKKRSEKGGADGDIEKGRAE